ncbi:receptor-type tyrosine-protein phosphatase R [Nephila pilipes]|uniref:protein-tyrosine-phosphatase n=1 Tax=Nephila pilipes TaxID=299642 RepID=A0A8X6NPL2_NEPPI|nr:receptor-type tyrosine-protein phosphatase R [Nephila pilipes]
MAVIRLNVVGLLCFIMFTVADSSPKMIDDDAADKSIATNQIHENPQPNKDVRVLHFIGNFPPEIIKAVQESLAKQKTSSSLLIDRLIPESNKIIFSIQLRKPMSGLDVIEQLSEAVAEHANLELDSIKVTKYEPYSGIVKMFFVHTVKRENNTEVLKLRPVSDIYEHLTVKKRLQNAGGAIKILDIHYGNDPSYQNSYGKKISIQSIFSDKNWEAWQLAVVISATLFAMFFIFVIFMFVSSQRIPKNKVRPVEEPRHVIVQPILRPVVAGVGVIQPPPENREHHIAAIDTDSEHTPSPSRSPMRRGRGLLERRGSNASLTLDLNRSQENIHCGTPPKECSAEEFLQSASKRLTRRQLRSTLKDVKALHTEFWEIPMNHPEKVEIAGSGTKNRYKTILPNETTRVHLYEKSEDPLSSYINANYVRGYSDEAKAYIATQGPLPHTVNDFWMMVWKEKSPLIVMITKLKEKMKVKCEPYIPDYQDRYGDIEVTVMRVIPREGYTVRELFLRRGSETHTVHHFWYTTWPDHKTPATAKQLLSMALEAEGMRMGEGNLAKGPMIVHCSAGIGRTGCFIAVSIGIQQLMEENSVDILGTVSSLRLDRGGMIQTAEQYEFVHQVLSIFELTLPEATGE